jgi:hypothetical protein
MTTQLEIDFEPGLTQRFYSLEEVCAFVVYNYRGGLKAVAARLDMSPSELSRRLNRNPDDPRTLRADHVEGIIEETRDLTPIHYLLERFCQDPKVRQKQALEELARLAPRISALLKAAETGKK